jgi:uncharacterized LabA/DUF88 family protein
VGIAQPKGFIFGLEDARMSGKMAVLVDGGFYLKRAANLKGDKSPFDRADELYQYCLGHVRHEGAELYRIFYYDCDPVDKKAFHPFLNRTIDLRKSEQYGWKIEFFKCLSHHRKVAIRKGEQLDGRCEYVMKADVSSAITRGKMKLEDLRAEDFTLNLEQKGVDVRIGLDVAWLAEKRFVDKIVLVTADSDFVPAAKFARRNGVDFILDNMWHPVRDSLLEHVDGLYTPWRNPRK